jgi:hypothetical protein
VPSTPSSTVPFLEQQIRTCLTLFVEYFVRAVGSLEAWIGSAVNFLDSVFEKMARRAHEAKPRLDLRGQYILHVNGHKMELPKKKLNSFAQHPHLTWLQATLPISTMKTVVCALVPKGSSSRIQMRTISVGNQLLTSSTLQRTPFCIS